VGERGCHRGRSVLAEDGTKAGLNEVLIVRQRLGDTAILHHDEGDEVGQSPFIVLLCQVGNTKMVVESQIAVERTKRLVYAGCPNVINGHAIFGAGRSTSSVGRKTSPSKIMMIVRAILPPRLTLDLSYQPHAPP
jgi:hypothetical protein